MLRTVESALQLLPGDKARERAEALAMRADALCPASGARRTRKAAWNVAAQRYDELGDKKSAARRAREAPRAASKTLTVTADGVESRGGWSPVATPETQDTSLAANGTGA